jgi:hypothetical protein
MWGRGAILLAVYLIASPTVWGLDPTEWCLDPTEVVVQRGILTAKGLYWLEFLEDGQPLEKMRRYDIPRENDQLLSLLRKTPVNSRIELRYQLENGKPRVIGWRIVVNSK